ncbi:MAG: cupin domain-containing protein [Armatimonadota bacterium]|nr:cupin domain-containing protein [Armatimonadota bacterium]MDR7404020.1 cupin domain-containing protein [Armatimonadota bacterium]MDR7574189.1 cupin domain-containing protein [Armatimonadota bacterium]
MLTRFVLVALRREVSAAAYEQFIREYDYPILPELRTVVYYRTHRIVPEGHDRSQLPFDYIEQIVVTDREAYREDLDKSPGFQRFRQLNPAFVDRTLDFWAEVVTPAPLAGGPPPPGVVFRWADVPEDTARPGVVLRRYRGRAMTAVLVHLSPGITVTPQRHPEEQLVHMLSGRLRLQVGDEARVLAPGDAALIPANIPHTGEAIGSEPAVYLEVLASESVEAGGAVR